MPLAALLMAIALLLVFPSIGGVSQAKEQEATTSLTDQQRLINLVRLDMEAALAKQRALLKYLQERRVKHE